MKYTAILLILLPILLLSYEKSKVDQAYNMLSRSWSYSENGTSVNVKSLKKSCKSADCRLIVNGKDIDPAAVLGETPSGSETVPAEKEVSAAANGSEEGRMKGITEAHNKYRKSKNLPELVWDKNIASYAQEWANHLKNSRGCKMQHRSADEYGENLAWSMGRELNSADPVKMWHDEEKDYNYQSNKCAPGAVCGHYTQVVWKNSKKLGCGAAVCGNSEVWVCNYYPPGNYVGEKPY